LSRDGRDEALARDPATDPIMLTRRQQFTAASAPMTLFEIGRVGLPCALVGSLFLFLFAAFGVSAHLHAADDVIADIGPAGEVRAVHTGFVFAEGPAADPDGRIYFTDVRGTSLYRATDSAEAELVAKETEGLNGLMFDAAGQLYGCQGAGGKIVTVDTNSGTIKPLVSQYNGKPFNSPNDLVVDSAGGIYFTDPKFGTGGPQDAQAFYYASADGQLTRLGDDLKYPNGIILSPDEKTLYVLPYMHFEVAAYDVTGPGKLGPQRILCEVQPRDNGRRGGGDGMSVDTAGNLYLAVPSLKAIQVVSPAGETLGLISIPKAPSNCAFGGADRKTLYVTAIDTLYAVPMEATGHTFTGGE
jgi:gluconolactonase